ncbi:ABC transporter ATP-binding protein [Candidatus Finniella inopinata]|uniref:ABC transporter ATP-binding protein n=1 Tax=Candidatus Finniella inopinata TaxID=1696036 RepID=A0A4Q7DIZ5_9PROT|nr:ABC transporter ATP-binding protein [Candidatus Finniella inopinata]RZI46803.1 ABC transporter ATP-binding protein [Candidatus Finniella inopinata]
MHPTPGLLKIDRLSKHFDGIQAINDLSLTVQTHEILGLIGPNGAGKTTLFQLISGFEQPDTGSILFNGQPIHNLNAPQIARLGIARTFQTAKPFGNLTVLENVMMGFLTKVQTIAKAQAVAIHTLDCLNLMDQAKQLADHLSLPNKKRLEIARALSTNPQLLLLDEVMAGLRPLEIDNLVTMLRDLKQQLSLTIIMIEHHMRAVMALCQRIVVLHQGAKIAEDTPSAIQQHPDVIKTYLGTAAC